MPLSGAVKSSIAIPTMYTNGSAVRGTHYFGVVCVSFAVSGSRGGTGNVSQTFISADEDGVDNTNRMFTIGFGTPLPPGLVLTPSAVAVTVTDDDPDPAETFGLAGLLYEAARSRACKWAVLAVASPFRL